jgi:hypothetical protein
MSGPRCEQGHKWTGLSTDRCPERPAVGSAYCAVHLAERMAAFRPDDRPRPWAGIVRASSLRRRGAEWRE